MKKLHVVHKLRYKCNLGDSRVFYDDGSVFLVLRGLDGLLRLTRKVTDGITQRITTMEMDVGTIGNSVIPSTVVVITEAI